MLPAFGMAALVAGWVLAGSPEASAKTTFDSPYTLEQTYNAALRLVRVDLGLKVTERDPAAAYVLFDYESSEGGRHTVPGSIEMIAAGSTIKVMVQLSAMPHYHEQVLRDHLAKKLRDEYGEPAPEKSKAAPPKADAGAGSDDDAG